MPSALIIGSGPAAAGATLALARRPDVQITVLDLGLRLEANRREAVDRLSSTEPSGWQEHEVRLVTAQPVASLARGLPEKRSYGSDFPFRDIGQLEEVTAERDVHRRLISAAYGGFSNVWGSQLMPFTAATLDTWPVTSGEMEPHYRAVLDRIPFAGELDDLAGLFPLIGRPTPLPELSERSSRVLAAYDRHRAALNRLGVTVGRARLAFDSARCVRCGLCMSGCPYGLIYSASQTFDELRRSGRVTYRGGLLAFRVGEEGRRTVVEARELATGRILRFEADRLYIACGALGSTRLVLGSLRMFDREITLAESVQFTLPMLSRRATPDPRTEAQFTLNQFNMVVVLDREGLDVSQLHFYTYDPAFLDAMPGPVWGPGVEPARLQVLRRLVVALGYLPSWASPRLRLRARPSPTGGLPKLAISREPTRWSRRPMLRRVLGRVLRSAPHLGIYPVVPRMVLAGGGKSYHFGGSFPHRTGPVEDWAGPTPTSDRLGRVGPWKRIYLVDATVFPSIAATTFTLTIMANAHRIASESMELGS